MDKITEQVIHNAAVEGMETSPEMIELFDMYENGKITIDELVEKTLVMIGAKNAKK